LHPAHAPQRIKVTGWRLSPRRACRRKSSAKASHSQKDDASVLMHEQGGWKKRVFSWMCWPFLARVFWQTLAKNNQTIPRKNCAVDATAETQLWLQCATSGLFVRLSPSNYDYRSKLSQRWKSRGALPDATSAFALETKNAR
jgi:hypothetical protein